ncbi:ADP-ribosylation factor-like protein 9 isoform X2 [Cygnus atratus]|uniref:ADP-ribosylation factor-like protein 9 isoform X2 n=1 Tax=Cygnus atratus TaxID=8868 RepID=UPI0015D59CAA|nr:ADP-ribosylation factor-like protein 9 isoform X2 [Cygnus atratus]XP_050566287.1 ADP-ribosylation factor-like protein 9 isoform X2 [Cygnus atratus]
MPSVSTPRSPRWSFWRILLSHPARLRTLYAGVRGGLCSFSLSSRDFCSETEKADKPDCVKPAQSRGVPVGGGESLRSYWKMYLPQVLLLIYVVDSADHARLPVAKQLLHQLIENNSTLPVVVLANKQDLEGAYCITDIHDALALSDIGDKRKMFLIGTHVAEDGSEISSSMKDAKELIAELFLELQ